MQKRDVKEFVRLTKWAVTFFQKYKLRMWTLEQIPVAARYMFIAARWCARNCRTEDSNLPSQHALTLAVDRVRVG